MREITLLSFVRQRPVSDDQFKVRGPAPSHTPRMRRPALCVMLLGLLALDSALAAEPICTVRAQEAPPLPDDPYEKFSIGKLQRLAKKNDPKALNALGIHYGTGQGVKLDSVKSFGYYQAAAALGMSTAQSNLAFMYLNGEGTEKDPALAFTWARKSAAAGDMQGLAFVGYLLGTGTGVERDLKEAAYCYLLAARRGNVKAQHTLATIYSDGIGIPVDRRQARLWRERAREAQAAQKAWIDPTPDPPMPPEWDSPFDFVAEIPGSSHMETTAYSFDVGLDASAGADTKWEHYTGRGGAAATALRSGLPGYDTVVVSVIPKEKLKPSENLLAAARRLQPTFSFAPVAGKKLCVHTSKASPVPMGEALLAYVAYCVRPSDRTVFELATSWKSLAIQAGAVNASDSAATADLKFTMDKLLRSFTFK